MPQSPPRLRIFGAVHILQLYFPFRTCPNRHLLIRNLSSFFGQDTKMAHDYTFTAKAGIRMALEP